MAAAKSTYKILELIFSLFVILGFPLLVVIKILERFYTLYEYVTATETTPATHATKVKLVQDQILDWIRNGRKTQLCTGRPSWQRLGRMPTYKDKMTGIQLGELDDIVEIDTKKRIVRAEPMVSMGKLSAKLIPKGWVVPVIPEFKDLTVGGLINGSGIETSSHIYGDFQYVCVEFEIVLADGRIETCSKEKNPDLFYAIPVSHGTLGFLTCASLMIIPAKKYVKLEYIPAHSLDEIVNLFETHVLRESGNHFVEGITYSLNKGVIMVGNMVDDPGNGPVNHICRPHKKFFHTHAKSYLDKSMSSNRIEYIPLRDYIHRHDPGYFWAIEDVFPFVKSFIYRYFIAWAVVKKVSVMNLLVPKWARDLLNDSVIVQDFMVPLEILKKSLIKAHQEIKVYPVWLCGTKILNTPGTNDFPDKVGRMFVDIGLYGTSQRENYNGEKVTKEWELYCIKHRGHNFSYSYVEMTKEEYGQMYNLDLYYKVRKQLKCEDVFPDVFDKVGRHNRC